MFTLIVNQTNLFTARYKNDRTFITYVDTMGKFLGILIHSGYKSYLEERTYWSNIEGPGCDLVKNSLSRNRFILVKMYIHFADNQNLTLGNQVAKVLPLYILSNSSIANFSIFHKDVSIDEFIIPYFGKHWAKMLIGGKLIRFGYKIFALCGSNGYPYHLHIYQGKEPGKS